MDVLNPSPVLCLPQTMWLTYRLIMDMPGLEQEAVLSLVVPELLRPRTPQGGGHAKQALTGLREFGLVQRDESGLFYAKKIDGPAEFLRQLRTRVVAPASSFGTDFVGAPDLRSGLVWLMRQSPLLPLHFDNIETAIPKGLFVNDTRWNAFRWWSQALGFSQPALAALSKTANQKAKIVPDPTDAVVDVIRHPVAEPLPRGERLPIGRLLEYLRAELPVLPGHPGATYDGMVSDDHGMQVLGLALSSAEQRQVLTMEYRSDPSGVMALPDAQDYGRTRYVSTVTIKE